MAKITPLDRLFVTVFQNGITRHFTELTGVNSFSDILNCMRTRIPGLNGMTVISVRNSTEGWTASHSVFFHS